MASGGAGGGGEEEVGDGWRGSGEVYLADSSQPHGGVGISRIAADTHSGRLCVTGGDDGSLRLLEVRSLSTSPPRAQVAGKPAPGEGSGPGAAGGGGEGHEGRVAGLAWLPNDNRLFVSGGDTTVKIWDASAMEAPVVSLDLHHAVHGVSLTDAAAAPCAAVALGDCSVRLVDLRIGRPVGTMQGHTRPPLCVAWGPSGQQRLYSGGLDGTVRAWDPRMGARSLYSFDPYGHEAPAPLKKMEKCKEELLKSRGDYGKLRQLAAAGKATKIDVGSRFKPYRFRSMKMGLRTDLGPTLDGDEAGPAILAPPGHGLGGAARPPGTGGGQLFGAPPTDGLVPLAELTAQDRERRELHSRESEEKQRRFLEPPRRVYEHEACMAHRGAVQALVAAPADRRSSSMVFDVDTGAPDVLLLSCGVDGKVRRWDAETGKPSTGAAGRPASFDVESPTAEQGLQLAAAGAPEDLCFVPEKQHLAVYCTRQGELLCRLAAHTAPVSCAEALPACRRVLSAGADGRLLVWRASSAPAEAVARRPSIKAATPTKPELIDLDDGD